MWGHPPGCRCPVCASLGRCFALLSQGWAYSGFGQLASQQVRGLEGELRDLVALCEGQGRYAPPRTGESAAPQAPAPVSQVPSEPPGPPAVGESTASLSQASKEASTAEEQCLVPKSKPASPPRTTKEAVKVEPLDSPDNLVDTKEGAAEKERAASSGRKARSRSRKRRSSSSPETRKAKRRSRSGRRRRDKGEEESPTGHRGREKRRRSKSPLRPRSPPYPPGPRSPSGPPPSSRNQGRGWTGPIPYSDHPRWYSGANKGIVKKAKQERHNQRRRQEEQQWRPKPRRR